MNQKGDTPLLLRRDFIKELQFKRFEPFYFLREVSR